MASTEHSRRSATRLGPLLVEAEGALRLLRRRQHPVADARPVGVAGAAPVAGDRRVRVGLLAAVPTTPVRDDAHGPVVAAWATGHQSVGRKRTTARRIRTRAQTTRPPDIGLTLPLLALAIPVPVTPNAALKEAIAPTGATPQPRRPVLVPGQSPRTQNRRLKTTPGVAVVPAPQPSPVLHVRVEAEGPRPRQEPLVLQSLVALAGLEGVGWRVPPSGAF